MARCRCAAVVVQCEGRAGRAVERIMYAVPFNQHLTCADQRGIDPMIMRDSIPPLEFIKN